MRRNGKKRNESRGILALSLVSAVGVALFVMFAGYALLNATLAPNDLPMDRHLSDDNVAVTANRARATATNQPEVDHSTVVSTHPATSPVSTGAVDQSNIEISSASNETSQLPSANSEGTSVLVGATDGIPETAAADDSSVENENPVLPSGNSFVAGSLKLTSGQRLIDREVVIRLLRTKYSESSGVDAIATAAGSYQSRRTRTDRRGNFRFQGLAAGDYEISTAPSARNSGASIEITSNTTGADLLVSPVVVATLEGQVTDPNGNPLAGVTVATTGAGPVSEITDEAGHLRLQVRAKADRSNRLKFTASGYLTSFLILPSPATNSVDGVIRFQQRLEPELQVASVTGVVSDDNGVVLPGVSVKLGSVSGAVRKSTETDEAGLYQFSNIPANANYRVAALPTKGYLRQAISVDNLKVGDTRADLTLAQRESNAMLRGRIVDASGAAVPEFAFQVSVPGTGRKINGQSDVSGYFELTDLPAGEVNLRAVSVASLHIGKILLQAAQTTEIVVPVDLGQNTFVGRVVDRHGTPVSGAIVKMDWESLAEPGDLTARTTRKSVTDGQGLFRFSEVGEGPRKFRVNTERLGFVRKTLQVHGGTNEVTLIKLKG